MSWTVAASGTPAPSYQWQISVDGGSSFTNISGATSATYSVTATQADSGKRVRVILTNPQGSVTSTAALWTVAAPSSTLLGRSWAAPVRIDTGTQNLPRFSLAPVISGADDQGRIISIYTTFDATTLAASAWAVRSKPGNGSTAPSYETPVRIGNDGNFAPNSAPISLHVAPNGNALVTWFRIVPCPAKPSTNCGRPYAARFIAGSGPSGTWEPQHLIADRDVLSVSGKINDAGDAVVHFGLDWAVATRTAAQAAWQVQAFPTTDGTVMARGISLSANGHYVVAGRHSATDGSQNVVARRGNLRTGTVSAMETLDTRSAPASFSSIWGGTNGSVVVMWSQNNGSGNTAFAATLDAPDGSWRVTDTSVGLAEDSPVSAAVTDTGDFYWYSWARCSTLARVSGTWLPELSLPSGSCTNLRSMPAVARNGNALLVTDANGLWQTIDAVRREVVNDYITQSRGAEGFVLGTSWRSLPGNTVLSTNGQGAVISINAFDTLPSATAPLGDSRNASVTNLWGLFFK